MAVEFDEPVPGPLVRFAKYVDGQLTRFEARTTDIEYFAISHVWGNLDEVELRDIPGIPDKVKCTPEKAKYLEYELPKLVNNTPFWMDVLNIDQSDKGAVVAATQSIPTIFRHAIRTIAIREGDGIYDCCKEVLQDVKSYPDFTQRFAKHSSEHMGQVLEESYLQRLWTLEECLLSKTIQFASVPGVKPKRLPSRYYGGSETHYKLQTDMERVCDCLFVLAYTFTNTNRQADLGKFINAYINCETITKPEAAPTRTNTDNIHTGDFRRINLVSTRSASKARDYIFSTMPQFEWYKQPANAKSLTFNEIFLDLCRQTSGTEHGFAYRIPRSLTDPKARSDYVKAWEPSPDQPEPRNLGDFLKLLGQRFDGEHSLDSNDLHVTSPIMMSENLGDHPSQVLSMIEKSMKFSPQAYGESHKGGELSKYSNFPELTWHLDPIDALSMGWQAGDNQNAVRMVTDGDESWLVSGTGWDYTEIDDPLILGELVDTTSGGSERETLLEHAIKVVDHMWCASHGEKYGSQYSDWEGFKTEMRPQWSKPLLRTMLLVAGMVTCGIGLSAGTWANKHFVPVYVRLKDAVMVGLLARHARVSSEKRTEVQYRLCVGRHRSDRTLLVGKDLILVDPETACPIGLIPDFLPEHDHESRTNELYTERMLQLYQYSIDAGDGKVGVMHLPLASIKSNVNPTAADTSSNEDDTGDMRQLVEELGTIFANASRRTTRKEDGSTSPSDGSTTTKHLSKPTSPAANTDRSSLKPSNPPARDLKPWNDIPDDFTRTPTPRSKTSTPRRGTPSLAQSLPQPTATFFAGQQDTTQLSRENTSSYEPPQYEQPEESSGKSRCVVM